MKKFKQKSNISKNASNEELVFLDIIKYSLSALLVFCIISIAILFLLSLILYKSKDPTSWSEIIGKVTLYLSALSSGFVLSKKVKQKYIPSGALLGAMIIALIFILSLIFPSTNENNSLPWLLLILPSTLLGSLLGIKRAQGPHKHKRHHK